MEANTEEREYHRVKLNDTSLWSKDVLSKNHVIKTETVYVLDMSQVIHCCELTPSYELWPSHYEFTFESGATHEEISDAYDVLEEGFWMEETKYIHCQAIDKMKPECLGEWDCLEDAREYYSCNH